LDLSDSPVILALVVGTFPLAGALLSLASGALADRLGRQWMMLAGFISYIAGFLVLSRAAHYGWLLLGQALIGLADVSFWIAAFSLFTELAPPGRQYAVPGMGGAAMRLGMITGPLVAGGLIGSLGFTTVFLSAAGLALAGLILTGLLRGIPSRNPPTGSFWASLVAYHKGIWRLITGNRAVLWASAVDIAGTLTWPVMGGSFYVLFLTNSGFSPADVGLIASARQIAAVLPQLGLTQIRSVASMPMLALAATVVGGLTVGVTPLLGNLAVILVIACLGGASGVATPMMHGFAAENTDPTTRSMWFALHNLSWSLVSPVALLIVGFVVETFSLHAAFFLCGAFVTVSVALLWVWRRRQA
jgi:MFS family permease